MTKLITKEDAILSLNPNAIFTCVGWKIDDCEIEWFDTTPISKADIKTEQQRLQDIEDAKS